MLNGIADPIGDIPENGEDPKPIGDIGDIAEKGEPNPIGDIGDIPENGEPKPIGDIGDIAEKGEPKPIGDIPENGEPKPLEDIPGKVELELPIIGKPLEKGERPNCDQGD